MQASLIYFLFVGPAATTLMGMATFAGRYFLLGTMPSTMLMAILSTMSKKTDGQLTGVQTGAVVLTVMLPLLDIYRCATAAPGVFEDGTLYVTAAAEPITNTSPSLRFFTLLSGVQVRLPVGCLCLWCCAVRMNTLLWC